MLKKKGRRRRCQKERKKEVLGKQEPFAGFETDDVRAPGLIQLSNNALAG